MSDLTQFTLAGWVNAASAGSRIGFFGQNDAVECGFIDSDSIMIWVTTGGNNIDWTFNSTTFPFNTWNFVTAVGNNDSTPLLSLYINGVLKGTTGTPVTNFGSSSSNFSVGGNVFDLGTGNLTGSIDNVMVFNRSLSAEEVYQLYASNLAKYNKSDWNFYVNQSRNATTGLSDGNYTYKFFASDDVAMTNETSERLLTVDTIVPTINIISPTNNTNSSNTGLDVTYTVSDTNLHSCWYNNQTGGANATLSGCSNITTITWTDDQYNLTIFANDSANNINSSSVTFTIDTTSPIWFGNKTNITSTSSGTVYFNATFNETYPGYYVFSFYNGTAWVNNSAASYTNAAEISVTKTVPITSGTINWTWYINDTLGNTNQTDVFTILIDSVDTDDDGITDGSDPLIYNESNVSTSGITRLNITIGGNTTDQIFSNVHEIKFYDDTILLVNFSHNFSATDFDLSNVTINITSTSLIINLSDQMQAGYNKTVSIADNSFASLCVKDAEVNSIDDVSSGCNGANETDLTLCIGSSLTSNGIICVDEGSTIRISNLRYSAVRGTQSSSSGSGVGGGGGDSSKRISSGTEDIGTFDKTSGGKKVTLGEKLKKEASCSDCDKVFDVIIQKFQSPIKLGEFFEFSYLMIGMANFSDDVNIDYWIEKEKEKIMSGHDVVYMGNFEEKTMTSKLYLPSTIQSGVYTLYVQLEYKQYLANSHRTIEIDVDENNIATIKGIENPETTQKTNWARIIAISSIIFILLLFISFYFGLHEKEYARKIRDLLNKHLSNTQSFKKKNQDNNINHKQYK